MDRGLRDGRTDRAKAQMKCVRIKVKREKRERENLRREAFDLKSTLDRILEN